MQMTNSYEYSAASAEALLNDMHAWMVETLGDVADEMMPELMEMYIEDSRQIIAEMQTSIQDDRWNAVQRVTHTLKGSSASVGLHAFAAQCKSMETAVKNNDTATVKALWRDLQANHAAIIQVLQRYLDAQ